MYKTENSIWFFLYEMVFEPILVPIALSSLLIRIIYIATPQTSFSGFREALNNDMYNVWWLYLGVFLVIFIWAILRAQSSRKDRTRNTEMLNILIENNKLLKSLLEINNKT